MKLLNILLASALIAVSPAPTCGNTPPTTDAATFETRLANGLKVIVKEDHRAPTAVHMVWYKNGSIDERDGLTGVAHVLEHLMFKGTRTTKPGEFNKRVAEAGGRDNAFTSSDYTAYFQIIPKRALPEMMRLEADRMRNLVFDPKEFAAEIKVVMEERRWRTEDNPEAKTYEAMEATAFMVHPYRRPVIGWMDDLEHMRWQDARDWYRQWYAPNNATVVIVGDVKHEQVFALAEKYYGVHKPMATQRTRILNEPPQVGTRRVTVKAPAKLPYLLMSWKVPTLREPEKDREPYALQMLAAVLDGHAAARLGRELVREARVAQSAGAGYDATVRGDSLFTLSGQPAEGRSVTELEAALREALGRIQTKGISEEELARVKVQAVAAQTYKRDSLMAQAMEIGGMEAVGFSWRDDQRMLEIFKSVTAAEVQAVANKYFGDDTLTVATLDPQPIDSQANPLLRRPALKH
ncbi:MAG: insulinase family protein [Rhodocyclaceae bacterium]|nr:insulinase family protein [Rhodocyclaceae bacterium]